jgi:hypothetical protein
MDDFRLPPDRKYVSKDEKLLISSFAYQVENLSDGDHDNEWDTLLQRLRGRCGIYWNVVTISDCLRPMKLRVPGPTWYHVSVNDVSAHPGGGIRALLVLQPAAPPKLFDNDKNKEQAPELSDNDDVPLAPPEDGTIDQEDFGYGVQFVGGIAQATTDLMCPPAISDSFPQDQRPPFTVIA